MREVLGYAVTIAGWGLVAFGAWAFKAQFEPGNLNRYLPPGPRLLRILLPIGIICLGLFVASLSGRVSGK